MVRLLAERYDTKSNEKLGGFRSSFKAFYVSSQLKSCDTTKTVYLWMTLSHYI